jgi:hypothetical protein
MLSSGLGARQMLFGRRTGGIFISYRRLDSKSDARSICQRLESTFGRGKVFIDVDSIRPGEDFQSVLNDDLKKCAIMVVVIGPRWLEMLKSPAFADGATRADYVRMELASALERKLLIFPVLVDGAAMPEAKDLPDELKPLAYRQALSVRHDSFPRDMRGLEQELRLAMPKGGAWKLAAACGLLATAAGAIAYFVWRSTLPSAQEYYASGNFACFTEAEYPASWKNDLAICTNYGCNFGKMSREACLTVGAKKQSQTVIHGNAGTNRENECWLQHSCGDLREHGGFTMFRK